MPPVNSLILEESSFCWSLSSFPVGYIKPSSAPCCLHKSIFSWVDAAAITFAPIALPSSTVARPTPPAAPRTKRVSPSLSSALCLRAYKEVP